MNAGYKLEYCFLTQLEATFHPISHLLYVILHYNL